MAKEQRTSQRNNTTICCDCVLFTKCVYSFGADNSNCRFHIVRDSQLCAWFTSAQQANIQPDCDDTDDACGGIWKPTWRVAHHDCCRSYNFFSIHNEITIHKLEFNLLFFGRFWEIVVHCDVTVVVVVVVPLRIPTNPSPTTQFNCYVSICLRATQESSAWLQFTAIVFNSWQSTLESIRNSNLEFCNLLCHFCLCSFSDVDLAGRDRCAMNVWCIRAVDMAIVMAVRGNVSVIQIGVAFYVIKVSDNCTNFHEFLNSIIFSSCGRHINRINNPLLVFGKLKIQKRSMHQPDPRPIIILPLIRSNRHKSIARLWPKFSFIGIDFNRSRNRSQIAKCGGSLHCMFSPYPCVCTQSHKQ